MLMGFNQFWLYTAGYRVTLWSKKCRKWFQIIYLNNYVIWSLNFLNFTVGHLCATQCNIFETMLSCRVLQLCSPRSIQQSNNLPRCLSLLRSSTIRLVQICRQSWKQNASIVRYWATLWSRWARVASWSPPFSFWGSCSETSLLCRFPCLVLSILLPMVNLHLRAQLWNILCLQTGSPTHLQFTLLRRWSTSKTPT